MDWRTSWSISWIWKKRVKKKKKKEEISKKPSRKGKKQRTSTSIYFVEKKKHRTEIKIQKKKPKMIARVGVVLLVLSVAFDRARAASIVNQGQQAVDASDEETSSDREKRDSFDLLVSSVFMIFMFVL